MFKELMGLRDDEIKRGVKVLWIMGMSEMGLKV